MFVTTPVTNNCSAVQQHFAPPPTSSGFLSSQTRTSNSLIVLLLSGSSRSEERISRWKAAGGTAYWSPCNRLQGSKRHFSCFFLTHRNLSESAPDFDFIARWARTYAAGHHFLNKNSNISLHFHLLSNWPFHSGAWALSRMPLFVTVERQQCHYRNENEFRPGGSIMHPKTNQCQRFLTPHLYSCQTRSCVTAWHPWDTFHINWSKWLDDNDNIAVTKVKHHELIELSQDHLPT